MIFCLNLLKSQRGTTELNSTLSSNESVNYARYRALKVLQRSETTHRESFLHRALHYKLIRSLATLPLSISSKYHKAYKEFERRPDCVVQQSIAESIPSIRLGFAVFVFLLRRFRSPLNLLKLRRRPQKLSKSWTRKERED